MWTTECRAEAGGDETHGMYRDRRRWRVMGRDPDPEPINSAILSAYSTFLFERSPCPGDLSSGGQSHRKLASSILKLGMK